MKKILMGLALVAAVATTAHADSNTYKVTITNLTTANSATLPDPFPAGLPQYGQVFAPILVATHKRGAAAFVPGEAASAGLARLAEEGDTSILAMELEGDDRVVDIKSTGGLLPPGASATVYVDTNDEANRISIAGMLVTTNDGFVGLNGVALPRRRSVMYYAPAWDAGSEVNDEKCANIPGPPCGTAHDTPGDDENGVVHIHSGIHGISDDTSPKKITAEERDWRNPVAVVYISRVDGRDDDDD